MDRGPRTGVTEGVSSSDLDFVEGVGLRMAGLASRIGGLLDWLANLIVFKNIRVFSKSR